MLTIPKTHNIFGEFVNDSYQIATPTRARFAPVPEMFSSITPDNVTSGTRISRFFTLSDFTGASRTRTLLKDVSATTQEIALSNMQRLCFEALDPATEYLGVKPNLVSGLASHDNGNQFNYNPTISATTIVGDSVFESFALGTGCAIQFDEDNESRLYDFALYIQASVIYDRCTLYYSSSRDTPHLIISVNEKARRRTNTVKDGRIMHEGIELING